MDPVGRKGRSGRIIGAIAFIILAIAVVLLTRWHLTHPRVWKYREVDHKFTIEMTNFSVNNQFAEFYFDVLEDDEHCGKLFKTYAEALRYAEENDLSFLPSVQMVYAKCKQFDDGMYAALEKLVQSGNDGFPALKRSFLVGLYDRLLHVYEVQDPDMEAVAETALIYVAAALHQGEIRSAFPEKIIATVKAIEPDKPIGFFTWDEELEAIFRQDRVLMNGIGEIQRRITPSYDPRESTDHLKAGILISHIVNSDSTLRSQHDQITDFYSHMTNPRRHPTVQDYIDIVGTIESAQDAIGDHKLLEKLARKLETSYPQLDYPDFSLIAYSFSREDYYVRRMWMFIDWDRQVMEQFIEAVRDGRIDLKPGENSGWYDFQQYALETLIMPEKSYESQKIEFSPEYKQRLEEAFKSILTQQRETHIKNLHKEEKKKLEEGQVGPEFSVEPLATVYLRYARSYRFVQSYLDTAFGEEDIGSIKRLREGRPVTRNVHWELERMVHLMYGLHLLSCLELGLEPNLAEGELDSLEDLKAREAVNLWLQELSDDDYLVDTRVAVPIARDLLEATNKHEIRYWATAGVRFKKLEYTYKAPPLIVGMDDEDMVMKGDRIGDVEIVPIVYYAPEDAFVEFETVTEERHPMNRKEFRSLCDKYGNLDDLKQALGAIE